MAQGQKKKLPRTKDEIQVQERPVLRIALAQELHKLEFRLIGGFDILSHDGDSLLSGITDDCRWMARVLESTPARMVHSVLVGSFAEKSNARALRQELLDEGFEAEIRVIGCPVAFASGFSVDNTRYRVIVGSFNTEHEAREHMTHLRNDYRARVVALRVAEPTGKVEFTDEDFGRLREVSRGFRLVPRSEDAQVELLRMPIDRVPGSPLEDRTFKGELEFLIDNSGKLTVINEVFIDTYLRGVLPAELDTRFPLEAHKAQAVAARSSVLSMLGMKHMSDDFDFCAGRHCQAYSGITHLAEVTDQAVEATAGEVLIWRKKICDAVYHACCGGHGEHKENIWTTPPEQVLRGRPDMTDYRRRKMKLDLSQEADFREWVLDSPEAWCNVLDLEHPVLTERSRKYFRWKEIHSRREMEDIIREKTGVDVGTLFDIVTVQRGVSGRIIELELIGSRRNLRLQKELNIRRALSRSLLFSSAFTVLTDMDPDGVPESFTLMGAGHGHGVGMCQVGAVQMALRDNDYREILKHYYPGTSIEQVFGAE